ncbi:uncharacterized protein LOC144607157 isoform X1 [Rhinoraja longicauda]
MQTLTPCLTCWERELVAVKLHSSKPSDHHRHTLTGKIFHQPNISLLKCESPLYTAPEDIRHPRGRTHMDPESPPSLHVKQLPLPPLAVDNFRVWCDWPRPTDGVCHGARADAAPGGVIPEAMLH